MTEPSGTKATPAELAAATGPGGPAEPANRAAELGRVSVVGSGRLGTALVSALAAARVDVSGPHGRGYPGPSPSRPDDLIVLCVPDAAIAAAALLIPPGPLVGHCSGASGLAVLAPHRAFSMHPVMTFTPDSPPNVFQGVGAAVDGTDADALHLASGLAIRLGMRPFIVAPADRAAYHAATAMAANFLVTLESAAGALMRSAGADPALLLPLARAALENWGRIGDAALTGPVARGDERTVQAHREAIAQRVPEYLPLFDSLADATRRLAAGVVDSSSDTRTYT
ncbi:Predicted oxidoreductase, contains short-chain dehydrogenase (SDR) and DUF2520 domains [Nakamurella panacisegetis]|uniref:Predicted oxidoreductase, contains short-chain dehydrogenase (SDR) and DUF2520 domains n=1 Tax=Nakamurella panacisegetis TaxID=1090615 RepID=A0A1H0HH18_9ACTN|nr:DUF2520 domain-containing protein [Nakamurella panacisegetis]SDO18151.1 Predicted oxidoreductase, contains short-chain dehydrogenase (SDR) and DUF2520 domains [Nakamurella panacisegetis]